MEVSGSLESEACIRGEGDLPELGEEGKRLRVPALRGTRIST